MYPISQGICGDGHVGALRLGDFKLVVFVEMDKDDTPVTTAFEENSSDGLTPPCSTKYRMFNVKEDPMETSFISHPLHTVQG
jgi:hypothetical protein